jgi:small GTP-binding protein
MLTPEKKHTFKILLLGDKGVGKTSIIRRYVKNEFTHRYKATIGVDFCEKHIDLGNMVVGMQLWDIAGEEKAGSLLNVYCRGAQAVIYVCDVNRVTTINSIESWKSQLEERANIWNVASILFVNKCDNPKDKLIHQERITSVSEALGLPWEKTSAAKNIGIERSIVGLAHELVKQHNSTIGDPTNVVPNIKLAALNNDNKIGGKKCCQ